MLKTMLRFKPNTESAILCALTRRFIRGLSKNFAKVALHSSKRGISSELTWSIYSKATLELDTRCVSMLKHLF